MTNSISGDLAGASRLPLESLESTGRAPEATLGPGPRLPARDIAQPPGDTGDAGNAGPWGSALSPRDLPVIMRALAAMLPTGIPIAQAAEIFLRAAVAADLRPDVVEQIQRLFAPLDAALLPAELAPMLRAFLAQSGLFTENHLAAALQAHSGSGPLTADQREAIADVRLLLGALMTADTPVPDPVRVFGDALLQQQLVVAEQLAATGSGQMAIPLMFGDERVDLQFTWDRQARRENQDPRNRMTIRQSPSVSSSTCASSAPSKRASSGNRRPSP